jgi:hypothetical protein
MDLTKIAKNNPKAVIPFMSKMLLEHMHSLPAEAKEERKEIARVIATMLIENKLPEDFEITFRKNDQ